MMPGPSSKYVPALDNSEEAFLLKNLCGRTMFEECRRGQARKLFLAKEKAGIAVPSWNEYLSDIPNPPNYLLGWELRREYTHLILVDRRGVCLDKAQEISGISLSPVEAHLEIWDCYNDIRPVYWIACQVKKYRGLRICHAQENFGWGEVGGSLTEFSFLLLQDSTILIHNCVDSIGSIAMKETLSCISVCRDKKGEPLARSISYGSKHPECGVWTRFIPDREIEFVKGGGIKKKPLHLAA